MFSPGGQPLQREDRATARRLFDERAYLEALGRYKQMRRQSFFRRLRAMITGAPFALREISEYDGRLSAGMQRLPNVQHVPLARIVGTDSRPYDFDNHFAPIRDYNCERWLGVAVARAHGRALPPVELVQIGDEYFVLDGHHRISVALAYGEEEIDAYVVKYADVAANVCALGDLIPA